MGGLLVVIGVLFILFLVAKNIFSSSDGGTSNYDYYSDSDNNSHEENYNEPTIKHGTDWIGRECEIHQDGSVYSGGDLVGENGSVDGIDVDRGY